MWEKKINTKLYQISLLVFIDKKKKTNQLEKINLTNDGIIHHQLNDKNELIKVDRMSIH